jgi:hypothetical protein
MYVYIAVYDIVMGENRHSALRNPHYSYIHSIAVYVMVMGDFCHSLLRNCAVMGVMVYVMGEYHHSALRNPHYNSINVCYAVKLKLCSA